eukprot:Sdes_comp23782_c0_seq1m21940
MMMGPVFWNHHVGLGLKDSSFVFVNSDPSKQTVSSCEIPPLGDILWEQSVPAGNPPPESVSDSGYYPGRSIIYESPKQCIQPCVIASTTHQAGKRDFELVLLGYETGYIS